MIHLPASLHAWNSPEFAATFKHEIEQQAIEDLPLQRGLAATGAVYGDEFTLMFLGAAMMGGCIHAKAGVFFKGIVAGCSCADDPTAVEPQDEYCEILVQIDAANGAATVRLNDDDSDSDQLPAGENSEIEP